MMKRKIMRNLMKLKRPTHKNVIGLDNVVLYVKRFDNANTFDNVSGNTHVQELQLPTHASDEAPTQQRDDFVMQSQVVTADVSLECEVNENVKISKESCYTTPKRRFFEPRYISEIQLTDLETPKRAKRILNLVRDTDLKKSKLIKALQDRNRKLQKRIAKLQQIIAHLKKTNVVPNGTGEALLVQKGDKVAPSRVPTAPGPPVISAPPPTPDARQLFGATSPLATSPRAVHASAPAEVPERPATAAPSPGQPIKRRPGQPVKRRPGQLVKRRPGQPIKRRRGQPIKHLSRCPRIPRRCGQPKPQTDQPAQAKVSQAGSTIIPGYQTKVPTNPGMSGTPQQIKVATATPQRVTRIMSSVTPASSATQFTTVQTGQGPAQYVLGGQSVSMQNSAAAGPRYVQETGNLKLASSAMPLKIGAANLQDNITATGTIKANPGSTGVSVKLRTGDVPVKIGTDNVLVKGVADPALAGQGGAQQAKLAGGMPVKINAMSLPVITSGTGGILLAGMTRMAAGQAGTVQVKTPVFRIVTTQGKEGVQSQNAVQMATPLGGAVGTTVLWQASGGAVITKNSGGAAAVAGQLQHVTLVKTSTGMPVASMPKVAMVQAGAGASTASGLAPGATIMKLLADRVGGNKIIMLPPNLLQLGKPGPGSRPTIVITKSAAQTAPTSPTVSRTSFINRL